MKTTGRNRLYSEWSPVATLEGTVSRMQRDLDNLRTRRATGTVPLVRQAALTTTKVPWFSGSTSWEQYQQVFDAIVLSNGWDDATPRCGIVDSDAPSGFQERTDGRIIVSLWITGSVGKLSSTV